MNEGFPETKSNIDALKSEHLKEGAHPIMASLDSAEKFPLIPHLHDILDVDLYAGVTEMVNNGFKKEGSEDYIISPIDKNDKFSHSFANCTGVVVVGLEEASGEHISFMSHQNPEYILNEKRARFILDLHHRLEEIRKRCEKGTIDAVMIGGRYARVKNYGQSDSDRNIFIQEYIDSIKLISDEIQKNLGFYPVVIGGPKLSPAYDSVTFDTQERRLHMQREGKPVLGFLESFSSHDIETIRKTWNPGEWGLPI